MIDDDERSAGETTDDVDRRRCRHTQRVEDVLDSGERCSAGEGGERPQAALVVGEEQVVAPADRGTERAPALRLAARRIAQHREAVVEAPRDLLDGQRPGAGGSELDRQRQPVERVAEVAHGRGRVVFSAGALGGGAAAEQLDGVLEPEWGELDDVLAVDIEWHLARAQHVQRRARIEQAGGEPGGGLDHVLAVVEDDDDLGTPEPVDERGLTAGDLQRGDHGVHHVVGARRHVEAGQPDAAGWPQGAARGDGHGGLADPARADDLDQRLRRDQVDELGELDVAADECCRHRRQVPGPGRAWPICRCGCNVQRLVVVEDALLQLTQLRPRREAELVGQHRARPPVGVQRIGLATGPVQRRHQHHPQVLVERMGADGGLEIAEQLAVTR